MIPRENEPGAVGISTGSLPLTRRLFLSLFPRKSPRTSGCITSLLQDVVIVDNQILRLNTGFDVNGFSKEIGARKGTCTAKRR